MSARIIDSDPDPDVETPLSAARTSPMLRSFLILLMACVAFPTAAEIEPLQVALGEMVEDVACHSDPTQTYTLYMPSTYSSDHQYPVLLVFDPRGRSLLAAELFREVAETYGWIIVSSDNTRSDGPWEPNLAAIQALWPEVHTRIPADFRRIYATGFSGGVAVATLLARTTGEIAGIIGCGGRLFENQLEDDDMPFFSTAGNADFNFLEMYRLNEFLEQQGNPHRLVIFDGPHTWMPQGVAREAIEWMEILAMKRGDRSRDGELIEALYAADLDRAKLLAADGQVVVAVSRLREMERTYGGIHDITEVKTEVERIEKGPEYRAQLKEAKRARDYEANCMERRSAELSLLRNSDVPPPTAQLAGNLHIKDLQRISRSTGEKGRAAQRCLNSLYSALSFYLPLDDLPKQRFAQVEASYELSLMIRVDNAVVWYNLACVRANLGKESGAIKALARSLELGFNNSELLATDTDLDPLRQRDDFKALMTSIPAQ